MRQKKLILCLFLPLLARAEVLLPCRENFSNQKSLNISILKPCAQFKEEILPELALRVYQFQKASYEGECVSSTATACSTDRRSETPRWVPLPTTFNGCLTHGDSDRKDIPRPQEALLRILPPSIIPSFEGGAGILEGALRSGLQNYALEYSMHRHFEQVESTNRFNLHPNCQSRTLSADTLQSLLTSTKPPLGLLRQDLHPRIMEATRQMIEKISLELLACSIFAGCEKLQISFQNVPLQLMIQESMNLALLSGCEGNPQFNTCRKLAQESFRCCGLTRPSGHLDPMDLLLFCHSKAEIPARKISCVEGGAKTSSPDRGSCQASLLELDSRCAPLLKNSTLIQSCYQGGLFRWFRVKTLELTGESEDPVTGGPSSLDLRRCLKLQDYIRKGQKLQRGSS